MRKCKPTPESGRYYGLTLAEWRGSVRAIQSSGWWVFDTVTHDRPLCTSLHHAVVISATLLLAARWHRDHAGRFTDDFYRGRRAYVDKWCDPARLRARKAPHER